MKVVVGGRIKEGLRIEDKDVKGMIWIKEKRKCRKSKEDVKNNRN
jgi:hypothetical protein